MKNTITIYSRPSCAYCVRAKMLMNEEGLAYQEINIQQEPTRRAEMIERSKRYTVPQIFIGELAIGGYDDLAMLSATGKLDELTEKGLTLGELGPESNKR